MGIVKRSDENPILIPNKEHPWESDTVFNGCPIKRGSRIHLLYRAVSALHYHAVSDTQLRVSTIGHAESSDGIHFKKHRQLIVPEYDWERFGCEDPRVTRLAGKYYIFYTALSTYPFTPEGIRVGLAISKNLERVDKKYPITPFNAKAMAMFPEKINGKFHVIVTTNTDIPPASIAIASFKKEEEMLSGDFWKSWYVSLPQYAVPLLRSSQDQIEVGAPPIKTKYGWLLIYSYIRNYFSSQKIFGIEAALLDLKNPQRIVGRTNSPIMVPSEEYELYGEVPGIIFPSGALIDRGKLRIYYGAADSTCCVASCDVAKLIDSMIMPQKFAVLFERFGENPILKPDKSHLWESRAVFNPAAFFDGKITHIVYRAMSQDNTSVFGYAAVKNGVRVIEREKDPIYMPRGSFEQKLNPGGNSGCEDPRITKIGSTLYMCYTAYDGKNPPRVALSSISVQKFLRHEWDWAPPIMISPPGYDDKDACIFPQKVGGKYIVLHRIGNCIDFAIVDSLQFSENQWLEEHKWLRPRRGFWDSAKVGIASPPIKTNDGWILLYHGVSAEDHGYRVGALLLDSRDPERILARTENPLLEPEARYEKEGQVPNVVFPCGAVIIGKKLFVYYGGGDSVVCAANIEVAKLLKVLKQSSYY